MPENPPETRTVFDRWLAAMLPDPVELAGVRLRPMTCGHALLLARLTGWEPLVREFALEDLPVALFILSRDWRKAAEEIVQPQAHAWLESLARRTNLTECAHAWSQYLTTTLVLPGFQRTLTPTPGQRGPGTPLLLRLRLFALRDLGLSPDGFEDLIFSDLIWLWLAHLEDEGAVRLLTEEDEAFERWVQEEEARKREKKEEEVTHAAG